MIPLILPSLAPERGLSAHELVSNELERGHMVAPSDVLLGGFGYYLAIAEARTDRREVAALLDWLNEEASSATNPVA